MGEVQVREIAVTEYPVLEDFLYNAIYIPEGEEWPPREIIFEPEIYIYVKDFGLETDCGVIAESDGIIVGAAWTRIIPAYGHIDERTPELAISVLPEHRGKGVGTLLMIRLFDSLQERGYERTSLSVQQNNPAVRFYKRLGYKITDEKLDHAGHEDYIMVKDLRETMNEEPVKTRCSWANGDEKMSKYHDEVWGRPEHDDQKLFAKLCLDLMQAGLMWRTILYKQENFQRAFDGFDIEKVARYDEAKFDELMQDAGIVRNRLKIRAIINNAACVIDVQKEFGSFDAYLWSFTNGEVIKNRWQSIDEVPASTPLSDAISKDLKKRGFRFVGSTIIYAFLQAVGVVNDHLTNCFCFDMQE